MGFPGRNKVSRGLVGPGDHVDVQRVEEGDGTDGGVEERLLKGDCGWSKSVVETESDLGLLDHILLIRVVVLAIMVQ